LPFKTQPHPPPFPSYPNVGKTSTLNVLLGEKRAAVSATPGKTKHLQTFRTDQDIMICDCPGLVFPSVAATKEDMICNGILPIDQMRNHRAPMELMARRVPREIIEATCVKFYFYVSIFFEFFYCTHPVPKPNTHPPPTCNSSYGVVLPTPRFDEDPNRPPTGAEIGQAVAFNRGFMTSAGNPDESRSARIMLKDLVKGRVLHFVLPDDAVNDVFVPEGFKIASREDAVAPPSTSATGPESEAGAGAESGSSSSSSAAATAAPEWPERQPTASTAAVAGSESPSAEGGGTAIVHPHMAAALEKLKDRKPGTRATYVEPLARRAELVGDTHGGLGEVRALSGKRKQSKRRGVKGKAIAANPTGAGQAYIRKEEGKYAPVPIAELRRLKDMHAKMKVAQAQQRERMEVAGESSPAEQQ
jgi:hypothetical protein